MRALGRSPGQVWSDDVHDTDELVMGAKGDVEFEICCRAWMTATGKAPSMCVR